ncbi:YdgA family protein [Kushneria sp. EE4]
MRKTTGIIGTAAVIIVVAGAAAPWYTGKRIEQEFRQGVEQVSTSVPMEVTRYDRGWRTSEAVTRAVIETEDGAWPVDIHHHITHGPWGFGWAHIDSTPDFGEHERVVAHYFGDQPPLEATTTVGFGNDINIDWQSPAFDDTDVPEVPGARLAWGGMDGHYRLDGDRTASRLSIPSLDFHSEDATLAVRSLSMEGSGAGGPEWPNMDHFWDGRFRTTLGQLNFQDDTEGVALKLGLDGQGQLQDNDDDGLSMTGSWQLSNMLLQDPSLTEPLVINNATQTLVLKGLPRDATRHLLIGLSNLDDSLDEDQISNQVQQMMTQYLMAVLQGTPTLETTVAGLDTPRGSLEGKLAINLEPGDGTERSPITSALARAALTLDMASDRTLLERLVTLSDPNARPASLLDGLEQEGLLVRDGERYRVDVRMDSRDLRVNGESHPELYMMLPLLLMSLNG